MSRCNTFSSPVSAGMHRLKTATISDQSYTTLQQLYLCDLINIQNKKNFPFRTSRGNSVQSLWAISDEVARTTGKQMKKTSQIKKEKKLTIWTHPIICVCFHVWHAMCVRLCGACIVQCTFLTMEISVSQCVCILSEGMLICMLVCLFTLTKLMSRSQDRKLILKRHFLTMFYAPFSFLCEHICT